MINSASRTGSAESNWANNDPKATNRKFWKDQGIEPPFSDELQEAVSDLWWDDAVANEQTFKDGGASCLQGCIQSAICCCRVSRLAFLSGSRLFSRLHIGVQEDSTCDKFARDFEILKL